MWSQTQRLRSLRGLEHPDIHRRFDRWSADPPKVVINGAMDGAAFAAYIREVFVPEI
jgi:hypothetical protein